MIKKRNFVEQSVRLTSRNLGIAESSLNLNYRNQREDIVIYTEGNWFKMKKIKEEKYEKESSCERKVLACSDRRKNCCHERGTLIIIQK